MKKSELTKKKNLKKSEITQKYLILVKVIIHSKRPFIYVCDDEDDDGDDHLCGGPAGGVLLPHPLHLQGLQVAARFH